MGDDFNGCFGIFFFSLWGEKMVPWFFLNREKTGALPVQFFSDPANLAPGLVSYRQEGSTFPASGPVWW
jgi:hypothetical protein